MSLDTGADLLSSHGLLGIKAFHRAPALLGMVLSPSTLQTVHRSLWSVPLIPVEMVLNILASIYVDASFLASHWSAGLEENVENRRRDHIKSEV